MISFYTGEEWKEVQFEAELKLHYAISNHGRFVSYTENINEGRLLKCSNTKGFNMFRYWFVKDGDKKKSHKYIHKLVAEYFLPSRTNDQNYVIHIDYCLANNHFTNLCWANKHEMVSHQNKNPKIIAARKKSLNSFNRRTTKLNEQKVIIIKRKLLDPNRRTRLKMIARQFGVSEMQLHRIKTGENWGHVIVEDNRKKKLK